MLNTLRRIGRAVPESALKDHLRVFVHNVRLHGEARFGRDREAYTVRIAGTTFRTLQPPYGVVDLLHRYQRCHRIRPGDTIIDVGAHWGVVALGLAALSGGSGTVVALEPDDTNRATFTRNLDLNPHVTNVRVLAEALWDRCETISFCERGALGSSALWDEPGFPRVTKPAITLDRLREQHSLARIDLIVMNAEGAELKALQGARGVIERFHPAFAIASNHFVDGAFTHHSVERQLREHGYTVETVWFDDEECITFGSHTKK